MDRSRTTSRFSPTPPVLTLISKSKLQKMVRFAMVMIQKGVSKSKLALDDLMSSHRHLAVTNSCRPDDPDTSFLSPISCGTGHVDVRLSYVSPRDYQFSCANNTTLSTPSSSALARRRRKRRNINGYMTTTAHASQSHHQYYSQYHHHCNYYRPQPPRSSVSAATSFGNSDDVEDFCEAASTVGVRQVRITDSPFSSLRGAADVGGHVDAEAERFIQKFYTDLRLQKWMAMSASYQYGHNVIY